MPPPLLPIGMWQNVKWTFWSSSLSFQQVDIREVFQPVEVWIDCCKEQHQNLLQLKHCKGPSLWFARSERIYLNITRGCKVELIAAINHNCTRVSHIGSKIGHLWFTRFTVPGIDTNRFKLKMVLVRQLLKLGFQVSIPDLAFHEMCWARWAFLTFCTTNIPRN